MFGFGKKRAVEKKISELAPKMDPKNAPASMTASGAAAMGMASLQYDLTVNEYRNSGSAKAALKSLRSIEKDVKEAMKK